MDDRLLVFKHLADLDGNLRLLVAVSQLAQVVCRRTDADDRLHVQLRLHGALDRLRQRTDILRRLVGRHLLDDNDVRLAHAEHEIMLPIREHILDQLKHGDVRHVHLPHQQHGARDIGGKVQLLGAHVHIARKDIVRDDVFDECSLVVLLLEVRAGLRHADGCKNADAARRLVIALHEHGILKARRAGRKDLIRARVGRKQLLLHFSDCSLKIIQARADHRELAASDHESLLVHNTDAARSCILHLNDHALKNSARHIFSSYERPPQSPTAPTNFLPYIIADLCAFFNRELVVFCE